MEVSVENDFDPDSPTPRRNGLGLRNVRSRLAHALRRRRATHARTSKITSTGQRWSCPTIGLKHKWTHKWKPSRITAIISLLGKGGMGEVFLAEDTRLHRKVALKVLLPEVAEDTEKLARFVQEARAASALSHPNVAHIYEIGEDNGRAFSRDGVHRRRDAGAKLSAEPLPMAEIVSIGAQVADALDAAHAAASSIAISSPQSDARRRAAT